MYVKCTQFEIITNDNDDNRSVDVGACEEVKVMLAMYLNVGAKSYQS